MEKLAELLKRICKICKFINISVKGTNPNDILNSVSSGISKIGKFFEKNRPDLVILLGDRYEILAAGIASLFHNLKIAHIHGMSQLLVQ